MIVFFTLFLISKIIPNVAKSKKLYQQLSVGFVELLIHDKGNDLFCMMQRAIVS
jgi:hypothetical protein